MSVRQSTKWLGKSQGFSTGPPVQVLNRQARQPDLGSSRTAATPLRDLEMPASIATSKPARFLEFGLTIPVARTSPLIHSPGTC
jgi:hypothetical protein